MKAELLTRDDLEDLCHIEAVCFGEDAWNKNMLEGEFACGAGFLGVKDGKRVIAYLCARLILDEADVNNVAVLPKYRRRGVARELLKLLVAYCAEKGISKFTLEVCVSNAAAKALYRKAGFKSRGVRKGYYHGEDAEIMWLDKENI